MVDETKNLTQIQYEKIEQAKQEKVKLLQLFQSKDEYVKVSPLIAFTTVKQYPDGTQKYYFKTDLPKEVKDNEDRYLDINKGLSEVKKDTPAELINEKARKISVAYQSANRAKNLAFDIAISNEWDYFVTLTFDNDKVDRLDDNKVRNKLGYWLENLRKKFPDSKYMFFPEYHKNGGLHFHGLLANVSKDDLKLVDSGYVSCSWSKNGYCSQSTFDKQKKYHTLKGVDGTPVYNMLSFGFGFSTVTLVGGSEYAVKYTMKYVTKTAVDERYYNKKRFWASQNVTRPYVEKIQLEVGSAYALRGSTDKHFIIEKNMLDLMCVDTSKWSIEYADDDIQYLIIKRKIDIIDESGVVTTIRKTQL